MLVTLKLQRKRMSISLLAAAAYSQTGQRQ
jgi:hypothetical protein